MPRYLAALFMQETNTFSPQRCDLEDFEAYLLLEGAPAIRAQLAGARQEMGGFLARAEERGFEIEPLVVADAWSAGPVTRRAFDHILSRILDAIRAALPADGVLLALHGAMVVEDDPDGDGAILQAVRQVVGPAVPIVATLDTHANVTRRMIDHADALVGYWTYPHIDMFETGQRAADVLFRITEAGSRPAMAFCKLPLIVPAEGMQTTSGPNHAMIEAAKTLAADPGYLDASVLLVQPWLDIPEMGSAVIVVAADGDMARAGAQAQVLAQRLWDMRRAFDVDLIPIETALDRTLAAPGRPVTLSDSADSTGSGSPGDSTAILKALIARDTAETALLTIVDPQAVTACFAAGVGATVSISVGGKRDHIYNTPALVQGQVLRLEHDARFRFKGKVATGVETRLGDIAVLGIGSIRLLLSDLPALTVDPELYRSVGLEPLQAKIVVVKSPNLFRANYASISHAIIMVDAPGLSSGNLRAVPFRHISRPIYPLDGDWPAFPGALYPSAAAGKDR